MAHNSYRELQGHLEDFKVRYRFLSQEEGGRWSLPAQGYRSDFWYEAPDHTAKGVFMIHPEFEDENGQLIDGLALQEGIARMWILAKERRAYHQQHLKVGAVGYFKEGNKSVAICEVIEIVDLFSNPVE